MFVNAALVILCNLISTAQGSAAPLLYLNQLYQFSGSGKDIINIPNSFSAVKGNNPRTIKFQMKTTMQTAYSSQSSGAMIATGALSGSGPTTIFDILLTDNYIYLWSNCGDIAFKAGPALNDNQWHSVAITYDGAGTVTLYVDHALVKAVTSFTDSCSAPAYPIKFSTTGDNNFLGTSQHTPFGKPFAGSLQNVVFYDYAQSASEAMSDIVPTTSPTAVPTISIAPSTASPSSSAPTITPSTAMPSFSPSVLSTSVVIPDLPRQPKCPEGWTLHATCEWTYGGKRLYQEASPESSPDDRYQFGAVCAITGLLIGMILMGLFTAFCNLPSKVYGRHAEYMSINESG